MNNTLKAFGIFAIFSALAIVANKNLHASTIASWTFETSAPTTAGPLTPEVGAGSATSSHTNATTYSSPVGNGSARSYSSNGWTVTGTPTDYYQFQVNTTGYEDVTLSWDQTGSGTGPRDYILQYSTDGTNFTNFGSTYAVAINANPNPVWNSTTSSPIY